MSDAAVARLALAISLVVAAWQVTQYLLSGGRVRITLRPGLWDEYALQQSSSTWASLHEGRERERPWGWQMEVAVVDIENIGREAVTISEVSLHLRSRGWWKRTNRRRVSGWPLEAANAEQDSVKRLQPFDRALYVLDVWQALYPVTHHTPAGPPRRPLRVRASVRVAGKRLRRLSPWWRGWRVTQGQVTFLPVPLELGLAAHQSLTRYTRGDRDMALHVIPAALKVRERFTGRREAPTADEIEAVIREVWVFNDAQREPAMLGIAALNVSLDLARLFSDAAGRPASEG